jgi:hypothetical protein
LSNAFWTSNGATVPSGSKAQGSDGNEDVSPRDEAFALGGTILYDVRGKEPHDHWDPRGKEAGMAMMDRMMPFVNRVVDGLRSFLPHYVPIELALVIVGLAWMYVMVRVIAPR